MTEERTRKPDKATTSPRRADQQDQPEPERPVRPDEEAGQSIEELDEPPQAEGPRD